MWSFVGVPSVVFGMEGLALVCEYTGVCGVLFLPVVNPQIILSKKSFHTQTDPHHRPRPWSGSQSSVLTGQAWMRVCLFVGTGPPELHYTLLPCLFTQRLVMLVKAAYLTREECNCDPYLWSSWNEVGGGVEWGGGWRGGICGRSVCARMFYLLAQNYFQTIICFLQAEVLTSFCLCASVRQKVPCSFLGGHICPEMSEMMPAKTQFIHSKIYCHLWPSLQRN